MADCVRLGGLRGDHVLEGFCHGQTAAEPIIQGCLRGGMAQGLGVKRLHNPRRDR